MEIRDKKVVITLALTEFQRKQVDDLVRFVNDRDGCFCHDENWRAVCHCVDLWRSADEALRLIKEI